MNASKSTIAKIAATVLAGATLVTGLALGAQNAMAEPMTHVMTESAVSAAGDTFMVRLEVRNADGDLSDKNYGFDLYKKVGDAYECVGGITGMGAIGGLTYGQYKLVRMGQDAQSKGIEFSFSASGPEMLMPDTSVQLVDDDDCLTLEFDGE